MGKKIKVMVDVEIPTPPNFLRLSDFEDESATIDVADITDEALREIAAKWTEALLENAASRRAKP